jgi:D-tyrosyl-tRNA(Tyr) deacylase
MRAVVQRVSTASVRVDDEVVGAIGSGLLVLVGVAPGDGPAEASALADKLAGLRVFADEAGKMNLSIRDVGGEALVVSQFTLLGDVRKGRRPSFTGAAPPHDAEPIVESLVDELERRDVTCATGRFGAMMTVSLVNDGPVTMIVEVADGAVR